MQVLTPYFSGAGFSVKQSLKTVEPYFRGFDDRDSESDQLELATKKPKKKMSLLRKIAVTLALSGVGVGSAAGTLGLLSHSNTENKIEAIQEQNRRLRSDYEIKVLGPYQKALADFDARMAQAQPDYDQAVTAINTEKITQAALIEAEYSKDVALLNADYDSREADLKSLKQFLSQELTKAQERIQILERNGRIDDPTLVDLQAEILQEFYTQLAGYLLVNNGLVVSLDNGYYSDYLLDYLNRDDEDNVSKMASNEFVIQNTALIKESGLLSLQQGFHLWLQEVGLNNAQALISRGYDLEVLDGLGDYDSRVTQYFDRMVEAEANAGEQQARRADELSNLEAKKNDGLAAVNQTVEDRLAALPSAEATAAKLRQEKVAYEKENQPAPFDESQLGDPSSVSQEASEPAQDLGLLAGGSLIASLMALGLSSAQAKLLASKKSKKEIEAAIQEVKASGTDESEATILRRILESGDTLN